MVGAVVLGLLASARSSAWAQELFVANRFANSITVYSRTASGDTAPIRTLSGGSTRLNNPFTLALDRA